MGYRLVVGFQDRLLENHFYFKTCNIRNVLIWVGQNSCLVFSHQTSNFQLETSRSVRSGSISPQGYYLIENMYCKCVSKIIHLINIVSCKYYMNIQVRYLVSMMYFSPVSLLPLRLKTVRKVSLPISGGMHPAETIEVFIRWRLGWHTIYMEIKNHYTLADIIIIWGLSYHYTSRRCTHYYLLDHCKKESAPSARSGCLSQVGYFLVRQISREVMTW